MFREVNHMDVKRLTTFVGLLSSSDTGKGCPAFPLAKFEKFDSWADLRKCVYTRGIFRSHSKI